MALPRNLVRLIESLRRAWPAGATADALARELDIQPWRVGELLGRLEEMRFPLDRGGAGVRLDPAGTPLLGELIEHELGTRRVGRSALVFERAGSTNDVAWQGTRRRESDGLVVLAETQSAGRGRLGRSWFDRPGASLLFSVLLLDVAAEANELVMAASVALAEAIDETCGLAGAIRWPNDLYIDGRKLAGILLESRAARGLSPVPRPVAEKGTVPLSSGETVGEQGGEAGEKGTGAFFGKGLEKGASPLFADVVIGIGINCNQAGPDDFPYELRATATSLAMEAGRPIDRTALIRSVLRRLDHWLAGGGANGKGTGNFSETGLAGEKGTGTFFEEGLEKGASHLFAGPLPADRLHAAYLRWMDQQARRVRIHHDARVIEGTVRDVDPINGLIVELPAGGIAHFAPATVSVEWLGG